MWRSAVPTTMSGNCTSNVYTLSGHVTLATGVDDRKSQYY